MKKAFKITLITILSLLLALTVTGLILFGLVNDKTDNTPEGMVECPTTEQLLSREMTQALLAEGQVSLDLTNEDVNAIIYSALVNMQVGPVVVCGAYTALTEDGIAVQLPVTFWGMRSCLYANVKIGVDQEGLTVQINHFKLGKLGMRTVVKGVVGKLYKDLKQADVDCSWDSKKLAFNLSGDGVATLIRLGMEGDDNAPLMAMLARLGLNENLIDWQQSEEGISVTLDDSRLKYNGTTDGNIDYPLDYDGVCAKVQERLAKGVDPANVGLLFACYTYGYDAMDEHDQIVLRGLGVKTTQKGVKLTNTQTMVSVLANHASKLSFSAGAFNGFTMDITQGQINAVLQNMAFVGTAVTFTDGQSVGYIGAESVSFVIMENNLTIRLIVNVQGRRLCVKVNADCPQSSTASMILTPTEMRIGKVVLDDGYRSDMILWLDNAVDTQSDWLTVNVAEQNIELNLTICSRDSGLFEMIENFTSVYFEKSLACLTGVLRYCLKPDLL